MKKQITYPKFIPRVFAMTMDLIIVSIVLTPIMNIISYYVFIYSFYQFFVDFSISTDNLQNISQIFQKPEFATYITASRFLRYLAILFILNTLFMMGYFIFFWRKFGATPGKMIMRMKIVDADDYSRPSTYRLFRRFLGYTTIFIGIFRMAASSRGQAIHDRIANTVVIKT